MIASPTDLINEVEIRMVMDPLFVAKVTRITQFVDVGVRDKFEYTLTEQEYKAVQFSVAMTLLYTGKTF